MTSQQAAVVYRMKSQELEVNMMSKEQGVVVYKTMKELEHSTV